MEAGSLLMGVDEAAIDSDGVWVSLLSEGWLGAHAPSSNSNDITSGMILLYFMEVTSNFYFCKSILFTGVPVGSRIVLVL